MYTASGTSRIHMLWFNESSLSDTKVQTGVHKSGDQKHIKLVISGWLVNERYRKFLYLCNRCDAAVPHYSVLQSSVQEVVLPHKWGNIISINASSDTGTCISNVRVNLFKTTSESPDMMAGGAMHQTDSYNIDTINWWTLPSNRIEGIAMGCHSGSQWSFHAPGWHCCMPCHL